MEDSKKKPIMIGIIVVGLGVAGLVTFMGGEDGGIEGLSDDKMVWVKCNNPACKAEYQMSQKAYYKELEANMNPNPMARSATALTCKECGKQSLYGAFKCANPDCGVVFIQGIAGQNDFPDRCPVCGKSETEESRERRKREMTGG